MDHLDGFGKAIKEFLRVLKEDAGYSASLLTEVADRFFLALKRYRSNQPLDFEDFLLVRCLVPAIDPSLAARATRD